MRTLFIRRKFLESLRNCYELQSSFIKCAKDAIIERTKRREVDDANQAVSIIARKRHSPQILEVQLTDAFQKNSKLLKLICVDCTSFCPHPKAVHVYVEVDEVIHFPDYILLITSYILNKHEEKCAEVVFLSKGTLNMYTDKYEKPTRFEFRDDLLLKKINNGIIHVLNSDDEDVLYEVNTITNCQTCYDDVIAKPLNMKSFDTDRMDLKGSHTKSTLFRKLHQQKECPKIRKFRPVHIIKIEKALWTVVYGYGQSSICGGAMMSYRK